MKEENNKCGAPAMFRYTWPGKDETVCCALCAMKLQNIAQAIGLYLQMIPLSEEDKMNGLACTQNVR